MLYKKKLQPDELQFGYQEKTSTTMCTWLAVETIDYFMRNGSEVFVGVLDMSKAFDHVKQSDLFKKMIDRNIPSIHIRLLIDMYVKQRANVKWNNSLSQLFRLSNGVKQGGVLSPHLFNIYTDDLFKILRRKQTGCWIRNHYVGILGYADDLLLLSPSLDGLQEMFDSCSNFAKRYNLKFSTHSDPKKCKTKCIAYLEKERNLRNIMLDGKELPWVKKANHLGCKLTDKSDGLKDDLMEKCAIYINKVNEISQEFHYANPYTKIRINQIFNSHFFGSSLWNLFGLEADRLEKTWNISQRILLGLPRNAHRYFLEPLTNLKHITFSLYSRFLKFIESLKSSEKSILRNIFQIVRSDCRSNTGNNLRNIMKLVGKSSINDLRFHDLKSSLTYSDTPDRDEWKIGFAKELIDIKFGMFCAPLLTKEELEELFYFITTK